MELNSGPKIANSTCGKTIDVETIDRDSTVLYVYLPILMLRDLTSRYIYVKVKKVKCSCYRPVVAQRVGRGIALLFHDLGTRRGCVVSSTPRPTLPPGKTQHPLHRRLGGPQGRSGRAENLVPTGIRSPDRPARSQSLYRLSYPITIIYSRIITSDLIQICVNNVWMTIKLSECILHRYVL